MITQAQGVKVDSIERGWHRVARVAGRAAASGTPKSKGNGKSRDRCVVFAYIESFLAELTISQGPQAGQLFQLMPWQRKFLRGAFSPGVQRAALTCGRANGKSGLVAAIATLYLTGPLAVPRGEVVVLASSFGQARDAIGEQVLWFLGGADALREAGWRVEDNSNRFRITTPSGARLSVMAADSRRAHGRPGIVAAILDEPAQWEPGVAEKLLAAITTSAGKQKDFRILALGTRASSPEHWFSRWLDGLADYVQTHEALESDPPFQRRTWLKSNPSMRFFPHLEAAIRVEVSKAKADSGELAAFKALRLNLGVDEVGRQSLLDAGVWAGTCEVDVLPPAEGPSTWGIDLGSGQAMSAISCYHATTGRLSTLAAFPRSPDLASRGAADHVGGMYERMYERQELATCGGLSVDVSELLALALERFGPPGMVVADRWREKELIDALNAARIPGAALVTRGQGFKDGGADCRDFRRACIDGHVKALPSLLLRSALAGAVTVSDPAGNAKLAKSTEGGRRQAHKDDAAASAILAVAVGRRGHESRAGELRYAMAG